MQSHPVDRPHDGMARIAVDLWWTRFDDCPVPAAWLDRLDAAERAQAERFRHPADRLTYVGRHVMLRDVLGRRLRRPPAALRFVTGPFGKPALHPDGPEAPPFFNLTGSRAIALLAICQEGEVGADVEHLDPGGLEAATLFTPGERRALARLAGPARVEAFVRTWVCKEAALKALGQGLWIAPDAIEISPSDTAPAVTWMVDGRHRWPDLTLLRPVPGTIAAVASFGAADVALRRWTEPDD